LFTPQDQDDFLEKLQHLLTNAGLRQEMGRNGRSCIAPYSWNQTVQNLVEVWQDQIDHNCKSR
jgi:glycosyltransferase involved in cell wall biosynthesis